MPDVTQLPLRDIHLPGAPPWWPLAPGWWALGAIVLAAALIGALLYYRARHRRAALAAVRRVTAELERGAEPVACLQQLSTILRRYAITVAEDRGRVAGLIGRRWLEHLDSCWDRAAFVAGSGRLIVTAPYARPESVGREAALELAELCRQWIAAQPLRASPRSARAERRRLIVPAFLGGSGLRAAILRSRGAT